MSPHVDGGTTTPQKASATHAWHHLLKSALHTLPKSLERSRKHRAELRRLSRHR